MGTFFTVVGLSLLTTLFVFGIPYIMTYGLPFRHKHEIRTKVGLAASGRIEVLVQCEKCREILQHDYFDVGYVSWEYIGKANGHFSKFKATETTYKRTSTPPPKQPASPDKNAWWVILGVSVTATKAQINSAYIKLALKHHPDKKGGSVAMMAMINNARDVGMEAAKV